MENFKSKNTFAARLNESQRILMKFPERIPIICEKEKAKSSEMLPDLIKQKFLVPRDIKVFEFMFVIRSKLKIGAEYAIFITINGIIPNSTEIMSHIYEEHKDDDGFLYVTYGAENTFGQCKI